MLKKVLQIVVLCVLLCGVNSVFAETTKYYLHTAGGQQIKSEKSILALDPSQRTYVISNLLGISSQSGKYRLVGGAFILYDASGSKHSRVFGVDPGSFNIGSDEINLQWIPTSYGDKSLSIKMVKVGAVAGGSDQATTFTTPEKALEMIFYSAKAGDLSKLRYLCDPQHQGDQVTECICSVTPGYQSQHCRNDLSTDVFKTMFRSGKINGKTDIQGNYAVVPFLYGPNNDYAVKMKFVRRGQAWYIFSFLVS